MHHEYLMQWNEQALETAYAPLDCECEEDTLYYYEGEELIGQLSLYIEAHRVNLFDVEIMPEYRGNGQGKRMLLHFFNEEWPYLSEIFPVEPAKRSLVLQVSETNVPALRLYRSLGFQILEDVCVEED